MTVRLARYVRGPKGLAARLLQARMLGRTASLPVGVERLDYRSRVKREVDDRLVSGRIIQPGDTASMFGTGDRPARPNSRAERMRTKPRTPS